MPDKALILLAIQTTPTSTPQLPAENEYFATINQATHFDSIGCATSQMHNHFLAMGWVGRRDAKMKISKADRGAPDPNKVVLIANSAWNLAHFRRPIIKKLVEEGLCVIAAAPADGFESKIAELGARFVPLSLSPSSRSGLADVRYLAAVVRLLRSERPDVVLSFTIKPNIFGSIAARISGIPAIATISGLGSAFIAGGVVGSIVTFLFRLSLAKCRIVFFQNSTDRDFFLSKKLVDPDKTALVPGSGIDVVHFRPAPLPTEGPFTFLMIARLLRDKGICEFAGASQILRDQGVVARFRILGAVGVDNPSAVTKCQVARWVEDGLLEHIEPQDDVRPMISDSHVVVLPSYREGLPRSLLEGAAMARPLIAANVPGCRDVVIDGENGILCAPRSAEALAGAMLKVMKLEQAKFLAMGRAGRKIVEENFDDRLVSSAYLAAISR
jgi:glycosyltransferase involved in cell wall biosynthesis